LQRSPWLRGGAFVCLTLLAAGCTTKLVPAAVTDFGAEKNILVTLRDGETVKGHIEAGSWVTYTSIGRVYRAQVDSVSLGGDIVLKRPYLQEEYGRYSLQRERMDESMLQIPSGVDRIEINAYKIVKVEEVAFDRARSARSAAFWGVTIFVAASILGARL
jgi:hypothetical protein